MILLDRFLLEECNNIEKDLEAGNWVTRYMKAWSELWVQEFERLKREFNESLLAINCLQNQTAAISQLSLTFTGNKTGENYSGVKVSKELIMQE